MHRNSSSVVLLALMMVASACARPQQKPVDCSAAVTQQEMNWCAAQDANKAETEMNRALDALLNKYRKDAVFVQRVKQAQHAWLQFRDAELAAQFATAPGESPQMRYGSMYPLCYSNVKAALTRHRTEQLEDLLKSGGGC